MDKSDADTGTGLRKRQQIRTANKTVFAWIIAASIVVGICGVGVQFLIRQMLFNNKILSAISTTNQTLDKNATAYDSLKADVVKLVADANLTALRKGNNSTALQVIIDALPTQQDEAVFASSMQTEILGPSGVSITSFSSIEGTGLSAPTATGSSVPLGFNFSISGTYDQVSQAIKNMERSIRPITIQSMEIQGSTSRLQVTVTCFTYYQPAQTLELKDKVVKP